MFESRRTRRTTTPLARVAHTFYGEALQAIEQDVCSVRRTSVGREVTYEWTTWSSRGVVMLRELRPGVEVDMMEVAPPGWDAGNRRRLFDDCEKT